MSKSSGLLAHALLGVLSALAVGCGDADVPEARPQVDAALADVVLEGGASSRALERLVSATHITDPARAAVIDSPSPEADLPHYPIATFAWHQEGSIPPGRWSGHLLVFAIDADPALLRVFTSKSSYTPDEAAWETLGSVGTWTTLTIVSGAFDEDDEIAVDGGPFTGGAPLAFCVER